MNNTVITPEIAKEIEALSATKTPKQVANAVNINYGTVRSHMIKFNLVKHYGKKKCERKKRSAVPEGYFNEHERENWLM